MDEAQSEAMAQLDNEAQLEPVVQPDNEAHLESEVESEDSALDVRFGDSDDEVGLNDEMGLNDNGGVHSEVDDDLQGGAGSEKPKNKGGRPKKNVDVDEAPSKKRKGRPKKKIEVELEPILFEDESDEETLNLRKKEKIVVESDEEYESDELASDVDSEKENESEEGSKTKYPMTKCCQLHWQL
jgi:hypothetical protein